MPDKTENILEALRSIDPDILEQLAKQSPKPLQSFFSVAHQLCETTDPQKAASMLESLLGSQPQTDLLIGAARKQLHQLGGLTDDVEAKLRAVLRSTAKLQVASQSLTQALPSSPQPKEDSMAELLLQAIEEAQSKFASPELQQTLQNLAPLTSDVSRLIARAQDDPQQNLHQSQQLHQQLQVLEEKLQTLSLNTQNTQKLEEIIDALCQKAPDHPATPNLAATRAMMIEDRIGLEEALAQQAWQDVFFYGQKSHRLDLVRSSGRRLQVVYAHQNNMMALAELSHTISQIAHNQGDLHAEILALLEEAKARSRVEGEAIYAQKLVAKACTLAARADKALWARANLTKGEILSQFGNTSEARKAYVAIMRAAEKNNRFPLETCRGALRLGIIELSLGKTRSAARLFATARALSCQLQDWITHTRAIIEQASLALAHHNHEQATKILAQGKEEQAQAGELADGLQAVIEEDLVARHAQYAQTLFQAS